MWGNGGNLGFTKRALKISIHMFETTTSNVITNLTTNYFWDICTVTVGVYIKHLGPDSREDASMITVIYLSYHHNIHLLTLFTPIKAHQSVSLYLNVALESCIGRRLNSTKDDPAGSITIQSIFTKICAVKGYIVLL